MALREALTNTGVSVIPTRRVTSEHEAVVAARQLGTPVAIKADASGLIHKSDIDAVRLECTTDEEIARWSGK